ncbi:hypothetical protein A9R05_43210 (plasmid) [Burkholderia sp. KK1]|uniref:hypothetical protein n=1 Tax=Burkholderia sp. M701 TaxID=326454 RepID=UPI000979AD64|nr:hypothetical protein [Burkholderia sp. M701]AQH06084.1 hypothetical protein A9R05_43210 [Burkholderia sp. KK1]
MSTLQVLRAKGASKPVTHRSKIPADLAKRIEAVEAQVKERGLEIDWDAPVVNILTTLVESAERDLQALGENGGPAGAGQAAGGEQLAA